MAAWVAAILVAVAMAAAATFTMPVEEWRTGRLPVEPLPLERGDPRASAPLRVWIDTDAACGHGRTTDPDDCFGLLMLLRSPAVRVVGISTVHGNAPLEVTDRTTRELVARFEDDGGAAPPVHTGAATALQNGSPATPAREAITRALAGGPLVVVALGPLTNIAAALEARPDLVANISQLVAVMGRRSGHIFHPSEGRGAGAMLWGHGPVFRDFNFAKDPAAVRRVLSTGPPLTLTPYEAARRVRITGAELEAMTRAGGAGAWVADRSRGWLQYWRDDIGLDGFYPFDAVAAARVLRPDRFECAAVQAWVGEDPRIDWAPSGPHHLLVGLPVERPPQVLAESRARYCPRIDPPGAINGVGLD